MPQTSRSLHAPVCGAQFPPVQSGVVTCCCARAPQPAPSQRKAVVAAPQAVPSAASRSEQRPVPSQLSAALQAVVVAEPQAVPAVAKPSFGQLPAPSHRSVASQPLTASRQTTVDAFGRLLQLPTPSQLSASSQTPDRLLPQLAPSAVKFAEHCPFASQRSPPSHAPVARAPQPEPTTRWLDWQSPSALQLSALSHSLTALEPQSVPGGSSGPPPQAPMPSQKPAPSQGLLATRQVVPAARGLLRQRPAPSQLSGVSHSVAVRSPQAVPPG